MRPEGPTATTGDETPVFFDAGGHRLFGIITSPTVQPVGAAVVTLTAGAMTTSVGRNQFFVRLCRRLAAAGYHAMRFDYHGLGESEGEIETFRLHEPFVEDLMGALRTLRTRGVNRFVLVGTCFGGRTALSCAPQVDRLEGLAGISVPILDFEKDDAIATRVALGTMSLGDIARRAVRPHVIRGFLDQGRRRAYRRIAKAEWRRLTGKAHGASWRVHPQSAVSLRFLEPLQSLAQRQVPILLMYGDQDEEWRDVQRAAGGPLSDVVAEGRGSIQIVTLSGILQGFVEVQNQNAVLERLLGWLHERVTPRVVGSGQEGDGHGEPIQRAI